VRIALLTTSWPAFRGDPAGHFVQSEARALEDAGHEVVVLAPPAGGAFGWPGVAARVQARPLRAFEAVGWVSAARAKLVHMNVDRVVAHWAVPCGWPIAPGARGAAIELVSHGGDVRLLGALPGPARRAIVRAIASRAYRWRFVSEPLLGALLPGLDRETCARVERIAVIQAAPIDMPDVDGAVRLRRREFAGRRVAVSVGRLVASKRVDRAIEYVARSRDLDAIVIVGDGPERARLERLVRARRVEARFVGAVARPEALAWIGAADVLLHASRAEGLSTVVREATALGTPVRSI
jgi:glycosyltransferase involved in cell wall biosynthesis